MDMQLLEKALQECGNDLDASIKSLHELCLGYVKGNTNSAADSGANLQKGTATPPADSSPPKNLPSSGAEWVEFFVTEMMSAKTIDDARSRASSVLELLEKSIAERAGAEAAQGFHKENMILKEQIEGLQRENSILKRAVAIQHERQKEFDDKNQEVHNLKHMVSQYQEQLRTLEVNNYALTIHLQQAQGSNSSIPGRFHPDVF
jgi:hypothetical protein